MNVTNACSPAFSVLLITFCFLPGPLRLSLPPSCLTTYHFLAKYREKISWLVAVL